jgi:hypothetical protein
MKYGLVTAFVAVMLTKDIKVLEDKIKKIINVAVFTVFLSISSALYAETFMYLGNISVTIEFLGNAVGQGRSQALNLQQFLESQRIRYQDVTSHTENVGYIQAIVRRHTIRKGDIYLISIYYPNLGETKMGVCEFVSDTQYTYWFYGFVGN